MTDIVFVLQNYAMANFRKAFQFSDSKSTLAANGIGSVLAEQGFVEEAKKIFQRVRESTDTFADGWVNLAHMYVAEKMYFEATKLYEMCLRKYSNGTDTRVLQFLARAMFDWGKSLQDKGQFLDAAAKLRSCQHIVKKALHFEPSNQISWFNLAVTQLHTASCVVKQNDPQIEHIKGAMQDLRQAKATLTSL